MQQAIYKVPEGKLLKIFLEQENQVIKNIKITGDFFIYPEEKIKDLEQILINEYIKEEELTNKIQAFIKDQDLDLFGVDAPSIAKTIIQAANLE